MSPSTEPARGRDPDSERDVGLARTKGVAPTLGQRLQRTIAAAIPPPDERADLEDDEFDDDPFPDVPEELEPVDEEEPRLEPTERTDPTGRGLSPPAISFSEFAGWSTRSTSPGGSHLGARHPSGLRIRLRRSGASSPDRDEVAAADAEEDLAAIAHAIGGYQYAAIVARDQAGAFSALRPMTQRALARRAALGESAISRRRRIIVECPWGLTPLEFFFWKKGSTVFDVPDIRALARVLLEEPDVSDSAASRRVAELARGIPKDATRLADALRHQVPVLRVLLAQLTQVNAMASSLPFVDLDELEATLGSAVESTHGGHLAARGKTLVRLGLAGAFVGLGAR
jgi:hypothetical protein